MKERHIRELIRQELPGILQRDQEMREWVLTLTQEDHAPRGERPSHLDRVALEPQPEREEQTRKWEAKMSYQAFLDWADEDTRAEWVDGEVIMMSPASAQHQQIAAFLLRVLGTFVEVHDLGLVISAPFQMKLERGREPDLLFLAQEHLGRLQETYLDGPADLVIEIVSPESVGRDRGEKYYEYAQGGVPEYWLIDPQVERAEFYQLRAPGRYCTVCPDQHDVYHSACLPGFWLRTSWLWNMPLPNPLRVLGEIAGMETEVLERFLRALGA